MARTTDGFEIAEVDLTIRGPGQIFGTRQAGLPEFRFADLGRDADLVATAREEAQALLGIDADLITEAHCGLKAALTDMNLADLPVVEAG